MLFVISGPSGCGKSTLVKKVMSRVANVDFSVSHTTRKRRGSERDKIDYHFVSKAEFEDLIKTDRFAEWAKVHGHYYGTSKREIEAKAGKKDLLLDIDVQGAQQIRKKYKKAVFVFILPPVYNELKARLKKRGDESKKAIEKRLETAKKEIRSYPGFDYIVINEDLDRAVEELASVILSRRCELDARQKEIVPILQSFSEE